MLKTVKSFYVDSRACVRVGNDVSEWFPVNVELRYIYIYIYIYLDGWMVRFERLILGCLGKGWSC